MLNFAVETYSKDSCLWTQIVKDYLLRFVRLLDNVY